MKILKLAALLAVFATSAVLNANAHSVSLNWNPSASATASGQGAKGQVVFVGNVSTSALGHSQVKYRVYRSTTQGSGYSLVADAQPTTSYVDSTVVNGTTYYYVVTAYYVETNQESSYSNEVQAVIPAQ